MHEASQDAGSQAAADQSGSAQVPVPLPRGRGNQRGDQ